MNPSFPGRPEARFIPNPKLRFLDQLPRGIALQADVTSDRGSLCRLDPAVYPLEWEDTNQSLLHFCRDYSFLSQMRLS